jgi:hypothetical protein
MSEPLSKTIALRTVVYSELTSCMPSGSATYYQQAQKEGVPSTYAVFTVEEIDLTDGKYTYELEINLVSHGYDTATIEDLADAVQKHFDKLVKITDYIGVYFYSDRRNNVEEEDRTILRRRLTFSTYLYER